MHIDLSGKTALVTGSTAGIGFAIAKGLAASGAEVIINGRSQARVDEAIAKLKAAVPAAKLRGVAGDVAQIEGCNAIVTALPEVDILVNNAGIFEPKDFFEIPDEDWSRFFEINVMSGVRMARAYMQGMLKRNWGRIVFISSESAVNIPTEMIHYGTTKTAQLAISRGLAEQTRGTGVTVNTVQPGPTRSEGIVEFIRSTVSNKDAPEAEREAEFFEKLRPLSLIRRLIEAEEVAAMTAFLASPLAAVTNGAAIRVEGGMVPTIA